MRSTEYLTNPLISDVAQGAEEQAYQFEQPLVAYSQVLKEEFIIPAKFRFEESIPGALWSISRPRAYTRRAAGIHDWIYQNHSVTTTDGRVVPVTRSQADAVYKEFAVYSGAPKCKINIRWAVLRLFGRGHWLVMLSCLLSSCSQPILGLSKNQRLDIYSTALVIAGKPELAGVVSLFKTSAKQPVEIQP